MQKWRYQKRSFSSSVLWDGQRFVHTRCFRLDSTERRRTEQALRSAEKMAETGTCCYGAHEFNNPREEATNLLYLAKNAHAFSDAKEFLEQAQAEADLKCIHILPNS